VNSFWVCKRAGLEIGSKKRIERDSGQVADGLILSPCTQCEQRVADASGSAEKTMSKVEVRDSTIKGKGVFATRPIAKGEVILAIDDPWSSTRMTRSWAS